MDLEQNFKNALSSWASGVSVVTAKQDDLVYGLTVSSFSSLSLDPPLILVCIAESNRMGSMVRETGAFSVSLLGANQEELSNHFAKPGREPVAELGYPSRLAANGVPVLEHAIASVACTLHEAVRLGTHTIFAGRVVDASADESVQPLLYFRRGYRAVSTPDEA